MTEAEVYARYYNMDYGIEDFVDINVIPSENKLALFNHALFVMLLLRQGKSLSFPLEKFLEDVEESTEYSTYIILSALAGSHICYNSIYKTHNIDYYRRRALKTLFRFGGKFPINVFYWCIFFCQSIKYKMVHRILFPLFAIRIFFGGNVKTDLLHYLLLHSIDHSQYDKLYATFETKMKKKYGDNFLDAMMSLYYTNPDHPNRVYSKE